jgi:hypothetical protein
MAYTRFIKKSLLRIIGIDLGKKIELNYINLNRFNSKIKQASDYSDSITVKFNSDSGIYSHTYSERYSIELENVLVDTENNFIYIDTGQEYLFLNESTEWPVENILSTTSFPKHKKYEEIETASMGLPSTGFYHWVSEDLPIFLNSNSNYLYLNYAKSSDTNKIILNEVHRDFVQVPKYVYVKRLKFNSKGKDLGKISLMNIRTLRKFSSSLEMSTKEVEKVFYISRSKSRRSLKNEVELEQLLEKLGVSIVHAEEFNFLDQIRLFSNARVIIGAHGAGLVHAIWADKCALFEIIDNRPINRCFEWQTLVQKNEYRRFRITEETNYPTLAREIYAAIQQL